MSVPVTDLLKPRILRLLRSVILFTVGISGVIYEVVVEHGQKPTILVAMISLALSPAILNVDERRKAPARNGDSAKDEP